MWLIRQDYVFLLLPARSSVARMPIVGGGRAGMGLWLCSQQTMMHCVFLHISIRPDNTF